MTTEPQHSKRRRRRRRAAPAQDGVSAPVTGKPRRGISHAALIAAASKPARNGGEGAPAHPFSLPTPPPGVVPEGAAGMAMDSTSQASTNAMFAWAAASAWHEGQQFLGYAYLSELAQRPEYRAMVERLAQHMTRKWIKLHSVGKEDKSKKIKDIEAELKRLGVQEAFRDLAEGDGFFGRAHLYLDTGATNDPQELKTPLTGADGKPTPAKVRRDSLKAVKTVEAVWCYPTGYDSNNPLSPGWYKPASWFAMGTEIHGSRLLTFIGREVPDMLKPAYSFGGLSLSQMAKPYVDNWLRTRQSVADTINAFSVMVLKTDLVAQASSSEGENDLFKRLDLFNLLRDNRGIMAVDRQYEDFANVAAPLSGLDVLQAQTQEHMSAVSGIPLVILLGITPSGLNASSEGEMQAFYDHVHGCQERLFRPGLTTVLEVVQLSLFGAIDPDITFDFEPLRSLDEKEQADTRLVQAQADAVYIDAGVLDAVEVRHRLADDESGPYGGLDPDRSTAPPTGSAGIPPVPPLALPTPPAEPEPKPEEA